MGILTTQIRSIEKEMPDCCGNCVHNLWDQDGCHCRNPRNWTADDYETEIGIRIAMDEDNGEIDFHYHCHNHKRGAPRFEG